MNMDLLQRAISLHRAGDVQQAEHLYRRILAADPDHADANHLLGLIAHQCGNHEAARRLILAAIHKNPFQPLYYANLAKVLAAMGRAGDAAECYEHVLRLQPHNAEACFKLGNLRLQQGNLAAAIAAYRQAIGIDPHHAQAHNNLGAAWMKQDRPEEAEAAFRSATKANPDYTEAHANLGVALKKTGKLEEAERALRQALTVNPADAESLNHLGSVLTSLGRLKEAQNAYTQALSLRPEYTVAFRLLAKLKRYSEIDAQARRMQDLFAGATLNLAQKVDLGFALGKIYEDIGDFDKAFAYLHEANRLFRSTYAYDLAEDRAFFDLVMDIFDKDFLHRHKKDGCPDATPIFIVGMPRSGTSLVEQILASHPAVHGAGELPYLKRIILRACGDIPGFDFIEQARHFDSGTFGDVGEQYVQRLRKHSDSATYITDKLPHNFFYLGLIKIILPQAKIIHCRRSPLDTCLSIYKNYFSDFHRYAYDLKELGEYYRLYQKLMEHWQRVLPENSIHDIQYELMVADQEEQTKALLDHCSLPWDERCLSFHRSDRAVQTVSAVQVRQPIYRRSLKLSEHYGSHLDPLRKSLGDSI